jgi:ribose transport system substrate-binding protein
VGKRRRSIFALFIAVALIAALVSGCGESSSSSSSSSESTGESASSGETNKNVAAAESVVKEWEEAPTDLGITEPVGKSISPGREIFYLDCGSVSCATAGESVAEAAGVVGWNVKHIKMGFSPEGVKAAFEQVIREKPDAVVQWGVPSLLYEKQLAQLKQMGIPVVTTAVPDKAGNGILWADNGAEESVEVGKVMADWVIADSGGKANAVLLDLPSAPILAAYGEGFEQEFKAKCPGCQLGTVEMAETDLGTNATATKTVGYLRSHPETTYVVPTFDDLIIGLPPALKSAGLNEITIMGENPSPPTLVYLKDGEQAASVSWPVHETAWKDIDVLARYFNKESIKPDETPLPRQIITGEDVEDPNEYFDAVPDYKEQFSELWGK